MPKPISTAAALRALNAAVVGKPQTLWRDWPLLPAGLPLDLVEQAMRAELTSQHSIGVVGRALPEAYVAPFFAALKALPKWPLVVAAQSVENHVDGPRAKPLTLVLRAINRLGVFSASRSQLEASVRRMVSSEPIVEACRHVVLRAQFDEDRQFHRHVILSVLLEDGSDASLDALVPDFERARHDEAHARALRECLRWRRTRSAQLERMKALLAPT